ncbi:LamG-like jellyroll fold domain-containing protein [Rubritalea tangerina]|uniref:LamG-like jellyroll fold domain-containing protein n=1 Tax=Rubritalea tangerina TaxID=430798 RepID=A0ABW4Z7Z9_9BACT
MKLPYLPLALLAAASLHASPILDITFSSPTTPEQTHSFTPIWDASPNHYHGHWLCHNSLPPHFVATPSGLGINTQHNRGKIVLNPKQPHTPSAWKKQATQQPSTPLTLDGTSSFTLEAVINWNNTTSSNNGIMGQIMSPQYPSEIFLRESNGFLHYVLKSPQASVSVFHDIIDISHAKNDGHFHSIALALDSNTHQIHCYLDGKLIHTNTHPNISKLTKLHAKERPFFLGAYNSRPEYYFSGTLDRFRISPSPLSPNELLVPDKPKQTSSSLPTRSVLLGIGGIQLSLQPE